MSAAKVDLRFSGLRKVKLRILSRYVTPSVLLLDPILEFTTTFNRLYSFRFWHREGRVIPIFGGDSSSNFGLKMLASSDSVVSEK